MGNCTSIKDKHKSSQKDIANHQTSQNDQEKIDKQQRKGDEIEEDKGKEEAEEDEEEEKKEKKEDEMIGNNKEKQNNYEKKKKNHDESNHEENESNYEENESNYKEQKNNGQLGKLKPARLISERKESVRKKPNFSMHLLESSEASTAEILDVPKKSRDVNLIAKHLKSHFLFKSLPDEVISQLTSEMKLYKMLPNSIIFEQGMPGKIFFIIKKGRVEISVDKSVREILESGKGFGEVALLQDLKRKTRAKCIENTELWGLNRDNYRIAIRTQHSKTYSEKKNFIQSVPLFKLLAPVDIDSLVNVLTLHTFNQCEVILNEGDPGELMYFIKSGNVGCYINNEEVRKLSAGEFIGEQALLYDIKRTATAIALDNVELLALGRDDLVTVLGDHLESIIYKNSQRIAFENSKYLKHLLRNQVDSIINQMEIQSYSKGETVIKKKTLKGETL